MKKLPSFFVLFCGSFMCKYNPEKLLSKSPSPSRCNQMQNLQGEGFLDRNFFLGYVCT